MDVHTHDDGADRRGQGPRAGFRFELGVSALLGACLALPFWYWKLVVPAQRCCSDAYQYFYPVYAWSFGRIAEGSLPLWNPHQLTGIPALATMQGGLLYPPHLLYLVLPTHVALATMGVLHMTLAGGSIFVFCRRAGLGTWPGLVAGALVAASGGQPGTVYNPAMQESSAWLGVFLIGALTLVEGRLARGAAITAVATAMSLLAGFPQNTVYAAYACGLLVVILLATRRSGVRAAAGALAGLGLGVAVGAACAGAQLLPTLELAAEGARSRGVLSVEDMIVFGLDQYAHAQTAFSYVLDSRPREPNLPLGFSVAALALFGVALVARRHIAPTLAAASLFGLSIVFAMGPATPLYDLYLALPELGSFRQPLRILMLGDAGLAIGAAVGVAVLMDWRRGPQRGDAPDAAPSSATPGRPAGSLVGVVLLGVVVVELFATPSRHAWLMPYSTDDAFVEAFAAPRPALLALSERPDRIWDWGESSSRTLPLKAPSLFGLYSIADYEIMTLRRQAEYWNYLVYAQLGAIKLTNRGPAPGMFYGRVQPFARRSPRRDALDRVRLAEVAGARWVLATPDTLARASVEAFLATRERRRTRLADPAFTIIENRRALPRAYLTHGVLPAPDPLTLLARMSEPDFDPRTASYVEGDLDPASVAGEADPADRASIVVSDLHEVAIDVDTRSPALLVLSDSFYPGWTARVDAEAAHIHATNHLFRGVRVPAGRHRVTFRYRPASFTAGCALSAAGLALLAALCVRARREARGAVRPGA